MCLSAHGVTLHRQCSIAGLSVSVIRTQAEGKFGVALFLERQERTVVPFLAKRAVECFQFDVPALGKVHFAG